MWSYISIPKTQTQVLAFADSFHNVAFSKDVHMSTALIKLK